MSKKPRTLSLERITVAFAATDPQPHSLEAIATLAAGHKAKISCVFIEDADMLRAARLPFALEVCRATNVVRRIDPREIERSLKKRATAARKLFAETAERSGAKWSFEVVRKRTASAVLELAKDTDVTMFSAATSLRSRGGTASQTSKSAKLLSPDDESIVVLVDRSAASSRAVQVAHKLAEVRGIPLHAVVVAATRAGLDRLSGQLQRTGEIEASHIHGLCNPQFDDIAAAARACCPAAMVLPIAQVQVASERIRELEASIENPILIVK
jgi:nucleotide-binding universal stress UspA family protein